MSTQPTNPLTLEHLTQLRNALDVIQNAKAQVDMAKRAGLDVSQQEAQIKDAETKLNQIRNVYFPGQ